MSNVIVREKFVPPEGAPPSPTPIAEEALNRFPGVREHYAERDVLAPLENVPVIITIAARAGWAALAQDISDATETGRALLADWWRHAWTQTFQRPAFWAGPVSPPDPEAHPYPVPAAEPERDPEEDAPAGRAVADDEPAPATDATAVLVDIAQKQEAAKEPDATKVIDLGDAETTAVPAVKEEGEPDE